MSQRLEPQPALHRLTRGMVRVCTRHWFLHGCLAPLHRFAETRGYQDLIHANALRLLAVAHVHQSLEQGSQVATAELASLALDRFEVLARQGDPEAAFQVAEAHRLGFGRPANHWKALEAYDRAADLGHPEAALRREHMAAGEAILDDRPEQFRRQAILQATYGRTRLQNQVAAARSGYGNYRDHGTGLRIALAILAAAGLIVGYIATDMYFSGLGHWRPDPSRVAWGLIGKIHPPTDREARKVLPSWLRPDLRAATFSQRNNSGFPRTFALGDLQGRVVLLYVVDGDHPILPESLGYLKDLKRRMADRVEVVVVLLSGSAPSESIQAWVQEIADIQMCIATDPRALRPLGPIKAFPMTEVHTGIGG